MSGRRFAVSSDDAGARLDVVLARRVPELTRSLAAARVRDGQVRVDGRAACKPALELRAGQDIEVELPEPEPATLEPESMPLSVLYEDEELLVIDKPAGMVVHPAHGHRRGTLVNALVGRAIALAPGEDPRRPGVVHRLDRDTSGCLVVARTTRARESLMAQFRGRAVSKTYLAVVRGVPPREGRIEAAIGRDPRDRKRMSVRSARGRDAVSTWRRLESFAGASLLEVRILTGRTHQIRVHLASIGHPVLGDRVYGGARGAGTGAPRIARQALHAFELGFRHPVSGEAIQVRAPLPPDLGALLDALRRPAGKPPRP